MTQINRFLTNMAETIRDSWICWLFSPWIISASIYIQYCLGKNDVETIISSFLNSAMAYIVLVTVAQIITKYINMRKTRDKIIAKLATAKKLGGYGEFCNENELLFINYRYNFDGEGYRTYKEMKTYFPAKNQAELALWDKELVERLVSSKKTRK